MVLQRCCEQHRRHAAMSWLLEAASAAVLDESTQPQRPQEARMMHLTSGRDGDFGRAAQPPPQPEGHSHPGVTCDVCGTCPVVGVRHKCASCPDFDSCSACLASGQLEASLGAFGCRHAVMLSVRNPDLGLCRAEGATPGITVVNDERAQTLTVRCHYIRLAEEAQPDSGGAAMAQEQDEEVEEYECENECGFRHELEAVVESHETSCTFVAAGPRRCGNCQKTGHDRRSCPGLAKERERKRLAKEKRQRRQKGRHRRNIAGHAVAKMMNPLNGRANFETLELGDDQSMRGPAAEAEQGEQHEQDA